MKKLPPINIIQMKALWLSVEHWHENWADPRTARIGSCYCPCCRATETLDTVINCHLCAIGKAGYKDCEDTPYYRASAEAHCGYDDARAAFEDEYVFLVNLALAYARQWQKP